MRFTPLLEASRLPKGTLHRILQTLIEERYIAFAERDQTYRLGSRPFQLAHRVWDQFDLRGAAEPELIRLAELSAEAARLGILDGDKLLYIDQRETRRQVRLSNGVGARSPMHATALGKAIAAHLSEAERRSLAQGDLQAFTDQTIISTGDLDQQLNIIKARGYAISIGERHDEVSAVAAPILDHRARPIGAVGIVGPSFRLNSESLHALGREVIEASRRISGNIGELAMSISANSRPIGVSTAGVRCAIPGSDFLGEGPFWSADDQRLYWVDILAPGIVTGDPATGERSFRPMPELIGVAIPKVSGGFVCATETGIKALSADGGLSMISDPERDRPDNRFNDGKCDAKGRLWVGSLAIDTQPDRGALWRCDPDGATTRMDDGFHVSNGLGWSPDDKVFYFTDSARRVIWAYDFDLEAGAISNRRPFIEIGDLNATPDGLTVDAEGFLWVALWDGWCVQRFDPEGRLERKVDLPVPRPTSCTFGGPDLSTLFVTSARIRLSAQQLADAPLSGSVFAIDTDVRGLPSRSFAG